ncbi:MAG: phosphate acyltransferase [Gemmatimonadota bacterium]
MSFLDDLGPRAAATPRRIGFPEPHEERTRQAMARLAVGGWVVPVAIGSPERTEDVRRESPDIEVLDPADPALRGVALRHCADLPPPGGGDSLGFAVAVLAADLLDGVVAGAFRPTAEVLRAGLRILGTAPATRTVSGSFYLIAPDEEGPERVLTFTDAAVVPRPTALQLAEIAEAACQARTRIVGDEPRVAFLSYSTCGSAGGESVTRVRAGMEIFRKRCPGIVADGELQADAALVPAIGRRKSPSSVLAGRANVLVFPDLDAGNIAYKLVQHLAGVPALGPILQGLDRPLNDLSRGAAVEEIVHVACITALMAADPVPAVDPDPA